MTTSTLFALAALICWAQLCTQRTLAIWLWIYTGLALVFMALEMWGPFA
ncbi:hypothetical protein PSQ39_21270 [Curvibacter sp. HBC28]|uniref:Uncharacterized protein n=1 Tax=Curvibacter microcysteis TaxID=3026419 RepID=A0ABT5MKT4_9BURK|nr:hypothetical protein [Curvibacter sp. HBC28]MDD0817179.1 hypothetical protein [Curvibacter sp. HBC28]